jgi:N-ethylmaleimide reductase
MAVALVAITSKHPAPKQLRPAPCLAAGEVVTDSAGMQPYDMPRALETHEVKAIVQEHAQAARNARLAGFDGVELHCTSGYLPMQFLCSGTNVRTDEYGGNCDISAPVLPLSVCAKWARPLAPAELACVSILATPSTTQAMRIQRKTHIELMQQAAQLNLAYLHVMRAPVPEINAFEMARCAFWRSSHFERRLWS